MIYNEVKQNLFTVNNEYHLAHCISADAVCGRGIAKEFIKRFPDITALRKKENVVGSCEPVGRVYNLITKSKYNHKPTYDALLSSLYDMKYQCFLNKTTKLAMPQIACGLDRLEWFKVRDMIKKVFSDFDIEILICIV